MSAFVPRATYAIPASLPRSYYLGHHAAGLARMRAMLNTIDLVLECRDFRAPLTSRNPHLEAALAGRRRIVVYTKRDLGPAPGSRAGTQAEAELTRRVGDTAGASDVFFFAASGSGSGSARRHGAPALLAAVRAHARARFTLTGTRVLVAGLPNVGKSTVLNALRAASSVRGSTRKVAATGGLPGVTRRVGAPVKILEGWEVDGRAGPEDTGGGDGVSAARSEAVYVHDTPGVFMPYVPSGLAMLKLALCGAVKEGLVPPVTLADYLLFALNRAAAAGPGVYAHLLPDGAGPTNDVAELLAGIAQRMGKRSRGGGLDVEAAAVWFVQRWRRGDVGRVLLDDIFAADDDDMEGESAQDDAGRLISISQARKADKERRRKRARARRNSD